MDEWNAYIRSDLALEPVSEGSLSGLAFAVKDVFAIANYTNSAGNPDWLRTHGPADRHAQTIEKLLHHGARLRGTTVTDELMYSLLGENVHYGTPVNPKAEGRVPGGSSSGSAVAVAAGLVDFALGTDTGGSVRVPSSYCGIYGFRPSFGAVSMNGVIPLAKSFDTVGWMSRRPKTLLDVGRVLLNKGGAKHPGFRKLLLPEEAWSQAQEDVRDLLLNELQAFMKNGLDSEWVRLPGNDLKEWADTFRTIQGTEIWQEHGEWIRREAPAFGPGVSDRFEWASTLPPEALPGLMAKKRELENRMDSLLGQSSLIAIPTVTGVAPVLRMTGEQAELQRTATMKLTCIAGLAGIAQVTVPFASSCGNPIGLSFIAGRGQDLALLEWLYENSREGAADR
ncbi:amidase [Cohnella thailandensis]|uniref:Amidase n=1 Tax=Cohnella thailandensis TaxID=557557 RepID=A0A841SX66_9BACL|nr:amidase [Cohnella thailandensis]MBB6635509.1 amidase [Cohnella thailandensis]MBP1974889.1 amidase [Cohnella thailandensis]